MILKKPYAFLIKHFRLVHLILLVLSVFIMRRTTMIVNFFRSYVLNNYSAIITANFSSNFITFALYLAIIILLVICVAILYLFISKNKPKKFYLFYIMYYIMLFILMFVCVGIFDSLEKTALSADTARVYKDLSLIAYLPQIPFIVICFVRSLGFNVKQFDFESDIKGLEISDEDSEEVEINIGIDTYKSRRKIHRFLREFKYYVIENKFIVGCICAVIVVFLGYNIISNSESYIKNYKQLQTFTYKGLNITINDSIITNLDAGGKVLKEGKYYILLKTTIANRTNRSIEFDYENLKIYYGRESINPSIDLASNFLDYAVPYTGKPIDKETSNTYVFVYEIDESLLKKDFYVKLHTGIVKKDNVFYVTSINVKINPLKIGDLVEIGTVGLNQTLNFSGTYLLNSSMTINDYLITDKYMYTYNYCINASDCREYKDIATNVKQGRTLLVLIGNATIDKESLFSKSVKLQTTFMKEFATLEYTIEGTTYETTIEDVTPSNFNSGFIVRTTNKINDAEKINLIVTIRNKEYRIALKS